MHHITYSQYLCNIIHTQYFHLEHIHYHLTLLKMVVLLSEIMTTAQCIMTLCPAKPTLAYLNHEVGITIGNKPHLNK